MNLSTGQGATLLAWGHGLYDREACAAMVRQTIAETLALEAQDGIGTGEVIRRVAHPGGSTEKGLAVLDRLFVHLSG